MILLVLVFAVAVGALVGLWLGGDGDESGGDEPPGGDSLPVSPTDIDLVHRPRVPA